MKTLVGPVNDPVKIFDLNIVFQGNTLAFS